MKHRLIYLFTTLSSILIISACSSSTNTGPAPVEAEIAYDIPGNINSLQETRAPKEDINDHPQEDDRYTFYDLDTGATVSDSSSSEWDIAFDRTTVLANAGHGGGILLADGAYPDILDAPSSGYTESNASWYTYTGQAASGPQHAILPKEDKTLIVYTPDGHYAKVQILSYYEGNPDTSTDEFADMQSRPASGYFTFNYTLQTTESPQLHHIDRFTYFDLESGEIIEDSASAQWDIGFAGTTVIANAQQGGGIQSLNIAFEQVDEAATSGYQAEASDWYTYTGQASSGPQHAVLVNEGTTLLLQTPDGNYAKVRMMSYYKGNPDPSTDTFINLHTRPAGRYFTFEYAVQGDGSVYFE
ncbi:MAG: hypothetical protein FH748_03895 [Balneolaceae bacterium]|nr:hypothetical protein [Balneolaceae bacterium]